MKKILGLDIGTTSIGWAFVNEADTEVEKSEIKKLGVRVIQYDDNLKTVDRKTGKVSDSKTPAKDFESGKGLSPNAGRTQKRGMRRNLHRYQLRRDALISILKRQGFIEEMTLLSENNKNSTFSTYKLRAKSAKEEISLQDFAKVLLMINKKRGYKSSRKTKNDNEGQFIDGMHIAKELYEKDITPGQYVYQLLTKGSKYIPDFYRSDLQNELQKIWDFQKQFYPEILTDELKEKIKDKNRGATWKTLEKPFNIKGIKLSGKKQEIKLEQYRLRSIAISEKIDLEYLAILAQEINSQINNSSGYLGAISDRSKELFFNKQTVGENLYSQLKQNSHASLKNQVFYRQDYLDEFNTIWEKQKEFHPKLTEELKEEIRDVIIFYQRKLKSQKGLLSHCEFESWEKEIIDEVTGIKHKKIVGHRVIPKSSPLFQEFKIWQNLNNIKVTDKTSGEYGPLDIDSKQKIFKKLNIVNKLSNKDFLKVLFENPKDYEINFESIEGNRTNAELFKVYDKILEYEGEELNFAKMEVDEIVDSIKNKFNELKISTEILEFNSDLDGDAFDKQPQMQLWHLLYSFVEDNSKSGNAKLLQKLENKFGFKKEYAKLIANINLQQDYGNLSARAIRKILLHLREGNTYDTACTLAGYNHSDSKTKEEIENKELKDRLELLKKNSLRNPIVEKILNQMINVVNAIIKDEHFGKPDEIRLELARELKKSSKERKEMTDGIRKSTAENEEIRKKLQNEFGITKVTRNDIFRYKLWQELAPNGYHTIYTQTYIPKEKLFSKEFDIEHIIPQAKLFDDSFSNKTLALRKINIEKGNETAHDFLKTKLNQEEFEQYLARIERMYRRGEIKKTKYYKLKMQGKDIPDGFIDRDIRNTQYIAKKARKMLEEVVSVVNTTTGSVTSRLREDWQLINIMKEINLPKYEKLRLVKTIKSKNGQIEKQIVDWSKRNDHRHHAMDALTVAFTKHAHVQYLNNLSARTDERHIKHSEIYGIEKKYLYRDDRNKLLFVPPMPLHEFRNEAKKNIESILVSFKAKNKVVTRNKNRIKIKGKDKYKDKIELTPRGALHKETIYGKINQYKTKLEKVGTSFDYEKINSVANQKYRLALLARLNEFDGNPIKAFGGKNSPSKNPTYINRIKTIQVPDKVKLVTQESIYTIRKEVSPYFKSSKEIEKVIDVGIRKILQKRLDEFNGDPKKAFSNLDKNPIWLNKEKGIAIKRVKISGVTNAEPLHSKKDHNGSFILNDKGEKQDVDFVSTGNNHHVAIYRDQDGNLQDEVVSFFEAVWRVREDLPIINKNKNDWQFLFTMKQNEYFVFPSKDFDPNEIDLLDSKNATIISPHLFRVQKFSKVEYGNSAVRDYVFRHHLETQLIDIKETRNTTYKIFKNISEFENIVKVRINHLGQIVKVGEY